MIDRERLLAADHESQLRAEAQSRRTAMEAGLGRAESRSLRVRVRLIVGQWLVNTGRRLDAGNDPCGPAEARPA